MFRYMKSGLVVAGAGLAVVASLLLIVVALVPVTISPANGSLECGRTWEQSPDPLNEFAEECQRAMDGQRAFMRYPAAAVFAGMVLVAGGHVLAGRRTAQTAAGLSLGDAP